MEVKMKQKRYFKLFGSACVLFVLAAFVGICFVTPATAAPIKIKWACWSAPGSAFAKGCTWPLREIEKRTNGKVKFEEYFLGTLVPGTQEIQGVGKRIADMAVLFCPMNRNASLLAGVSTCPGVPTSTGDIVADSHMYANKLWEMGKTSKEVQDEFTKRNIKLAMVQGGVPRCLLSAKIPFTKPEDFKGRRTRALGDEAKIIESFGGAGVGLTSAEEYEGLSRGIVDFCVDLPVGAVPWKLHEVIKYWVPMVMGWASYFTVINLDTWNSLPPDVQKVFEEVAEGYPDKFTEILVDQGEPAAEKVFEEAGVVKLDWPPEQQAKIDAAAAPFAKKWALDAEKRGSQGKTVLNQWFRVWGREPVF